MRRPRDLERSDRALVEERGHTLAVSLPPDGVRVDADAVRLEQVVANLLTNAAKYTDTGGRGLCARRRRNGRGCSNRSGG